MHTSLYSVTIPTFKKGLSALSGLLDKADAFLKEKGLPEADLLQKRLAPDMFPFVKQVQLVSDQSKGFAARIQGRDPVSMEDTEASIAELKERIAKTIAVLDAVKPEDIDGKEDTEIRIKWFPGQHILGGHYALEYVLPNFFFHLTTAYDLLRAEGIQIGKADFIGALSLRDDA
ncbi:MAG TPA: DUF1993 domain-containing protein [Candidatus Paceibacterota bacterium]|nr:DUF1993 domain-containing protein [Candidatus Paceibacterota bacterium]